MPSEGIHVFAGPNGVGKSTLGDQFSKENNISFINPDAIKIQQEKMHSSKITAPQLNHIIDIFIENAINQDGCVLIENNLHNEESIRFILSYVNKYNSKCFCYFHYLDDPKELLRRVVQRQRHIGHFVHPKTVFERYKTTIDIIYKHSISFDEVHFYDTSSLPQIKTFDMVDGSLNEINDNVKFKWSDKLIDRFIASTSS